MAFFSRRSEASAEPLELPYDPRSPEGLASRWVRWAASHSLLKDPIDDPTGELQQRNQPEDVWFLAGTSGRRAERSCAVPPGRDLFIPLFNMWVFPATGPQEPAEWAEGHLTVDADLVPHDVITTPIPFLVAGRSLNPVTGSKRPVPTTVWGLWKLIPALAPGQHVVRAVGGDGYGFEVDVTYHLTVGAIDAVPGRVG